MNNAELREFCTQMIGKFKLLSDIQKEMQYETIDAKFTEWELKKLIFALNVLREEVRKYVDTADTPQTDKDKVVCPNCGRSDYIRSFEKDFNIKNSGYRYKCINCNTYIKDAPQTEERSE